MVVAVLLIKQLKYQKSITTVLFHMRSLTLVVNY